MPRKTLLELIDAETLYYMPLQKVPQLIEGLVPQGLNILCGAPKIGKSWLLLWMCLQIVEGKPVWERKTSESEVLYLALEDTISRLQSRLHILTDAPTQTLHFSRLCNKIGGGLEREIEDMVAHYPNTRFVIIDTLQKVRRDVNGNINAYSHDYSELSKLKAVADNLGICILLVHHLRKQPDSNDPINEVSGSIGIVGAVDTIYVLKNDVRFSGHATLYVSGRDIEQQELSLKFENLVWQYIETKGQLELLREIIPDFVHQVAAFMEGKASWHGSMTQLLSDMSITDLQPSTASKYLTRFCYEVLAPIGIDYSTHRTGKGRTLTLKRSDGNDAGDA